MHQQKCMKDASSTDNMSKWDPVSGTTYLVDVQLKGSKIAKSGTYLVDAQLRGAELPTVAHTWLMRRLRGAELPTSGSLLLLAYTSTRSCPTAVLRKSQA